MNRYMEGITVNSIDMDEKFFDARESENLLQSTDSISKGLFL